MKKYIGTKTIEATPMTKGDAYGANLLRSCPELSEQNDLGYKVRYEDGYESWSPKDVFEKAYHEVERDEIVLTKKERLFLSLELKVLETLRPKEDYGELATVIENGYTLNYGNIFESISDELSKEQCRFVIDVLNIYRAIAFSCNVELDKLKEDFIFQGFDFNDDEECVLGGYVRYFIEDLGMFEEIRKSTKECYNSHRVMIPKYKRMVNVFKSFNHEELKRFELTENEITKIINA